MSKSGQVLEKNCTAEIKILDRCLACVSSKKAYCRMTAKHIAPRCLPCKECNTAGLSVVKYRVTSKHKAANENSETLNLGEKASWLACPNFFTKTGSQPSLLVSFMNTQRTNGLIGYVPTLCKLVQIMLQQEATATEKGLQKRVSLIIR